MTPTAAEDDRPRLLVVGGCGGLVGRSVLRGFADSWTIRSLHRHPTELERAAGVEWVPGDVARVSDWRPYLSEVDTVLILAWYRQARAARFRALAGGLRRLVEALPGSDVRRVLHLSVPPAPADLETGLPYLSLKRSVDRAVGSSPVPHSIVRPTMLFGPGDRLLTVLVRLAARYRRLPLFGDGSYHVSPVSVVDLARILRREAQGTGNREVDVGGPRRWTYAELLARIFMALGRPARYLRLSPRNGVRLAALLEGLGSSLIYAYEVEWLVSDLLGLPPFEDLDTPLASVEPFLDEVCAPYRRAPE
jgi:uncharacterized protein YbjT (DUF2867 family)